MPAPIIPWQPSNIPSEIQWELERRKANRSFNFVGNRLATANWDQKTGDWNQYRGPMVSWIRMCSNSAGHPKYEPRRERLILHSGKGFYQSYGFQPPKNVGGSKRQIVGYSPGDFENGNFGMPHYIENDLQKPTEEPTNFPIHVPPPEISRIEVTVQKELFRRATVEWVCFSWKQLVYMTPYFLVPGITCMVEWGWNHFNVQSLVALGDVSQMQRYWDNAYPLYTENVLKSNGNYDVIYGIISNFNWSIEGNKIICTTEITSKDRLYAGIAKDYGLSVKDSNDDKSKGESGGIFQSLSDFLGKDDTAKSLRTLVTKTNPLSASLQAFSTSPQEIKWVEILNPLLTSGSAEQLLMRRGYVFGVFAGRPPDSYEQNENFGTPRDGDFDKSIQDNDPSKFLWINMGMVTEILNHFSALDSGAKGNKNMFSVDIQNTVISGHPNLISCDPQVLIPNYKAPKFVWGSIGEADSGGTGGSGDRYDNPYTRQWRVAQPIVSGSIMEKADRAVSKTFYHGKNVVYRDNLDVIINYNRKRYVNVRGGGKSYYNSWSFPSSFTEMLPVSINGLKPNQVEKDYSGLLSNVYISYGAFKEAVDNKANATYVDIYKNILQILMNAVDNYWDLSLVDVDGTLTVVDRNYVGSYAFKQQGDKMFSFDYYDADSLIKSLKFRPMLSDAQATRVIYGAVNNKDSQFKYHDRNDVLDYVFRDAVINRPEDKAQGQGELLKRKAAARLEHRDLVRTVQRINAKKDDGSLQMSLYPFRKRTIKDTEGNIKEVESPTIVKLCLNGASGKQLLRLILNDEDEENNARYCAVQPNIVLELTIQGIGGLRTFQYFIVRNLPEPYSDKNIIFRITDVTQTLESGNWETTIRAQPLPLRAYIKKRVPGPLTTVPNDGNGWPIITTK